MPPKNAPARLRPTETIIAVLLTLAAGYVDAIGYLKLNSIYVANMSGNSVAIGIHLAERDWPTVLERLLPVSCYVVALFCTRVFVHMAAKLGLRRYIAASLLLEVCFLVLFMRSTGLNSGIIFAAAAMGIQAATISKFNGVTVYTVFVTGSLVRFAETASEWLMAVLRKNWESRDQASKDALWFLSIWVAYVGGAAAGASLYFVAGTRMLVVACVLIAGLSIPDWLHPAEFSPQT